MRRSALLFAALVVLGGACSSEPGALPPPPSIPAPQTTTTELDYANVGLRGVPPGRTRAPAIPIGPGGATLTGSVIGPDGPVPDADIFVERIVNDGIGSMMIKAGPDGVWTLANVLGGRYRIRAWRGPDLALVKPTIMFIGAADTSTIDLRLTRYGGVGVKASIAPSPPPVGQPATLVVLVTTRTVDDRGVVRSTPMPGVEVELVGSGTWRVESPNPGFTDSRGEATWTMRCRSEGRQTLAATVGDGTFPLELPACAFAPTTTTFEEAPPQETTTTGGSGT